MRSSQFAVLYDKIQTAIDPVEVKEVNQALAELFESELDKIEVEGLAGPLIVDQHEHAILHAALTQVKQLIKKNLTLLEIYDEYWKIIRNIRNPGRLFYHPQIFAANNNYSRKILSLLICELFAYTTKKRHYTHSQQTLSLAPVTEEKHFYSSLNFQFSPEEQNQLTTELTKIGESEAEYKKIVKELKGKEYSQFIVDESNYAFVIQLIGLYLTSSTKYLTKEDVNYFEQLLTALSYLLNSDKPLDAIEKHTLNSLVGKIFELRIQFDMHNDKSTASPAMKIALLPIINIFNAFLLQKNQAQFFTFLQPQDWDAYSRSVSLGQSFINLSKLSNLAKNDKWALPYSTPNEINAIKALSAVNKNYAHHFNVTKALAALCEIVKQLPEPQSEEAQIYLSAKLDQIGTPGLQPLVFNPLDTIFNLYNEIESYHPAINLISEACDFENLIQRQVNNCLDQIIYSDEAAQSKDLNQYISTVEINLKNTFGLVWIFNTNTENLLNKFVNQQTITAALIRYNVAHKGLDPEAQQDFENYLRILLRQFLVKEIRTSDPNQFLHYSDEILANLKHKFNNVLLNKLGKIWLLYPQATDLIDRLFVPKEISRAQNTINYPKSLDIRDLHAQLKPVIFQLLMREVQTTNVRYVDVLKGQVNAALHQVYPVIWAWSEEKQILDAEITEHALELIQQKTMIDLKPVVDKILLSMAEVVVKSNVTPRWMLVYVKNEIKSQLSSDYERDVIDDLVTKEYLLAFANYYNTITNNYNIQASPSLLEFLKPHANKALQVLIASGYVYKEENSHSLKSILITKFDEVFTRMLGIVWVWSPDKNRILDELVIQNLHTIQNNINAKKGNKLGANSSNELRLQCKNMAIELLTKQEQENFQVFTVNGKRQLKVKSKVFVPPASQEISQLVDIKVLDQMMREKFQLVWELAEYKEEMMSQIISAEFLTEVRQQALENTVRKIVGPHFESLLYGQFYRGENNFEYKDDGMPFVKAIVPDVQKQVDEIMANYFKDFPQLWSDHPAHDQMLDNAINKDFVCELEAQALQRREELCKAAISRSPQSLAELKEWIKVLYEQISVRLDGDNSGLNQGFYCLATGIYRFNEVLAKTTNAIGHQWHYLKQYYQHLLATRATIEKVYEKFANLGGGLLLERELQDMLQDFESPEFNLSRSTSWLAQINKIMDEACRFQSENFLQNTDYALRYSKVTPARTGEKNTLTQQFDEAIKLFEDYAGTSLFSCFKHMNRHHRSEARSLAADLRMLLATADRCDEVAVVRKARAIVMESVQTLLKNGTLKANFQDSSFARRASYVLTNVLMEDRVKSGIGFKR